MGKELLGIPQARTELFTFTPDDWKRIGDDIGRIDLYAFAGDTSKLSFEDLRDGFSRENFEKSELISVLLKGESGSVIGYSQAEYLWLGGEARIVRTALAPEYQGKKLVGILMDRMEAELRDRGACSMFQKVRIRNGYADAVRRHYGDRIVGDYSDATWANNRCFVIKL